MHEAGLSSEKDMSFTDVVRGIDEGEAENATEGCCKRCSERDESWTRRIRPEEHGCSACKAIFNARFWDRQIIYNHRSYNRDLVCSNCTDRGYAPGMYETYKCDDCLQSWGSLMFDRNTKKQSKRLKKTKLICNQCDGQLRCDRCLKRFDIKLWSKNARRGNHQLVCDACRAMGFHAGDLQSYSCDICKKELGGKKFEANQVRNFKQRETSKMHCLECAEEVKTRVRQLQSRMRQSKRRCTCLCRIHRDACQLAPVFSGDKRWPGSDGAISWDDKNFLDALRPRPAWWSKAWGSG